MSKEFTVEITKSNDSQHSLVMWQHPSGKKEFVVCSYYDSTRPIGSQWSWGHYFQTLHDAMEYWTAENF